VVTFFRFNLIELSFESLSVAHKDIWGPDLHLTLNCLEQEQISPNNLMFPKGNIYISNRFYVKNQEWFDDNREIRGIAHKQVFFGLLYKGEGEY